GVIVFSTEDTVHQPSDSEVPMTSLLQRCLVLHPYSLAMWGGPLEMQLFQRSSPSLTFES
ncbi:unnamed protein product, partial [Sphenostylis stenocarpa]